MKQTYSHFLTFSPTLLPTAVDSTYSYHKCEAELNRNGNNFSSISLSVNAANGYHYYSFRQIYTNGYVRYRNNRQANLKKPSSMKFSLNQNSLFCIVGIKFDNISTGHFNSQIYNSQEQVLEQKDVVVGSSSYMRLGVLESRVSVTANRQKKPGFLR